MAAPKSTTLFHFTKSLDVLKSILKSGFYPRYSLEDINWMGFQGVDFVAFPVVCFCDIPLSRITDHVNFYGQFGIGMTQEWAKANRLNPVIYVSHTSDVAEILKKVNEASSLASTSSSDSSFTDNAGRLFGHTKPLSGTMVLQGKPVVKEFYQESEWRHLASHPQVPDNLNKVKFNNPADVDAANQLAAQHAALSFTPSDVKYLFVQDDSDIPELVSFINTELGQFPHVDIQVLNTRIVSQSTIENDL